MSPATFRLGYTTLTWGPEPDLDAVLATIAGAGWEGVEFIGTSADWLGTPARVRGMLDRYGLAPVAMLGNVGIGADAAASLERARRTIEYGAELGCELYCFIGGDRVPGRLPSDDDLGRLADAAERLVVHAAPFGMQVAYHAHPRCTVESEQEQDRLLGLAPRLGVCVDVSVAVLMGEDPVAQVHRYRNRLRYVHLKDWGRGKFCVLGGGTAGLDVGAVLEALGGIGYRGWVMSELSPYADTPAEASCRTNRAHLAELGY